MKKLRELATKILNKPLYFWSLVVFVYIIARVATWGYPFDSDHWIFYYVGKIWAQGGTMYVAAWDHKPPLIFVFNGLMYLMFGGNLVLHRLWLTLLSIVDIALFWQLIKRVLPSLFTPVIPAKAGIQEKKGLDSWLACPTRGSFGRATRNDKVVGMVAKVGLLLYVFWRNLSQFTSSGNNTENYGLIFFMGMLLSFLSFRKDQKWWKMLISGACFSVLFFLKGNFLLLGIPIGIVLLIDNWKSIRKFFGYGVIFATPLILQAGFWAYYFVQKGALNDFFIASFLFSTKYAKSAWNGDVSNNMILLLTLAIFLVPVLLFLYISLRQSLKNLKNNTFLLIKLSVFAGLLATLGIGSFYPYYFLVAMPVFVITMVYGLFNMGDMNKYFRYFVYFAFGASIVLSLGISMKQLYNSFSGSVSVEAKEYQEIADYVKANTAPTDKVFAYDYGATFYRLSDRDSGSRFISASVLLLEHRDNYGYNFDQKFIDDMDKSQAKYVVVYRDKDNLYYQNTPIVEYFNSHYVLDKTFTKFEVLKRK